MMSSAYTSNGPRKQYKRPIRREKHCLQTNHQQEKENWLYNITVSINDFFPLLDVTVQIFSFPSLA